LLYFSTKIRKQKAQSSTNIKIACDFANGKMYTFYI
jgi:hypothetical protein